MFEFVLASQSPRRRQLFTMTGYDFEVSVAEVDEASITNPNPAENAVETAVLKATYFLNTRPTATQIILAADTIVSLDGMMLGKPADAEEAAHMLNNLRDRKHEVHTGICLVHPLTRQMVTDVHTAMVTMRNYSDFDIETYVASGDPLDKAGAYAIQHPDFQPVAHLEGCYLGVMGLSICHLLTLFPQLNIPLRANLSAVAAAHHHYPCPLITNLLQTGEF